MHEHRQVFPILRMCQVLGVSENGYYNWRKRGKIQRKRDDEMLTERIEDAYYQSAPRQRQKTSAAKLLGLLENLMYT
jgi:hypothetical protein